MLSCLANAKPGALIISCLVILGFFGLLILLIWHPVAINSDVADILKVLTGTLGAKFGDVVAYHIGSSAGSKAKDDVLHALASGTGGTGARDMLALLTAIPGIGSFVATIVASVFNAKVQIATAKIGGDTAVATALVKASETAAHERTAALAVIAGNTLLTLLIIAFAGPWVIYEWKVVVYDTVLGLGTTAPIRGEVAGWANTIIGFIFGTTGAISVGKMWFARGGAAGS